MWAFPKRDNCDCGPFSLCNFVPNNHFVQGPLNSILPPFHRTVQCGRALRAYHSASILVSDVRLCVCGLWSFLFVVYALCLYGNATWRNILHNRSTVHFAGFFYGCSMLGPALGFTLGGIFLDYYTDFHVVDTDAWVAGGSAPAYIANLTLH